APLALAAKGRLVQPRDGAEEVDLDHHLVLLKTVFVDGNAGHDAGVVDDRVEPAEVVGDLLKQTGDFGVVSNVVRIDEGFAAAARIDRLGQRLKLLFPAGD